MAARKRGGRSSDWRALRGCLLKWVTPLSRCLSTTIKSSSPAGVDFALLHANKKEPAVARAAAKAAATPAEDPHARCIINASLAVAAAPPLLLQSATPSASHILPSSDCLLDCVFFLLLNRSLHAPARVSRVATLFPSRDLLRDRPVPRPDATHGRPGRELSLVPPQPGCASCCSLTRAPVARCLFSSRLSA